MDIKETKNGYKVTKELKVKRLKTHYPDLFPLNLDNFEDRKLVLKDIKESFEKVNFSNNLFITCKDDLLKPTLLYGLISLGSYVNFELMNAYRLLDIYLGKDDKYNSLFKIYSNYLAIYLGYRESANKRQSDVIEQTIENRIIKNRRTWIYYKGTKSKFNSKFPAVMSLLEERNFDVIEYSLTNKANKISKNKKNGNLNNVDLEI